MAASTVTRNAGVASLAQAEVYATLAAQAESFRAEARLGPHTVEVNVTISTLTEEITRLRALEAELLRDAQRHGAIR